MKIFRLLAIASTLAGIGTVQAEYLFNGFLDPWNSGLSTNYSSWNASSSGYYPFYAPNQNPNYPTSAAPYGSYGAWTSGTGIANPGIYSGSNPNGWSSAAPSAFWDTRNPTITQTGAPAFVSTGIYSFSGITAYTLDGGAAATSPLETIIFQFETFGTLMDLDGIRLIYEDGGTTHELSYNEILREFRGSPSAYGGLTNRVALQWNLTGLGVTSYRIEFASQESSMSLVSALLDTATSYGKVVPSSGTWSAASGTWSTTSNWAVNSTNGNRLPDTNANAIFQNSATANVSLDSSRTVGELHFASANSVTLGGPGTLTTNTGISTSTSATGTYTITSNLQLGALNLMEIEAGTVRLEGVVSGSYGLTKSGDGALVLANQNTFTGGIGLQGGTLRIENVNTYTGDTSVLFGNLVLAANAGSTGALGSTSSVITLGASSGQYTDEGEATSAAVWLDGNRTLSRNISLAAGTLIKRLGAMNASTAATYSGTINLQTSTRVFLSTQSASDRLVFSGNITNGSGTVQTEGPGTLVFSGSNKTYASKTQVNSGTLIIESSTAYTGSGDFEVTGGRLVVNGSIAGSGVTRIIAGTLSGSGNIATQVITSGAASHIAPGNSPGTITLNSLNASAGVTFDFELGGSLSDSIHILTDFTSSTTAGGIHFNLLDTGDLTAGIYSLIVTDGNVLGFDYSDLSATIAAGWALDTSWSEGENGWWLDSDTLKIKLHAIPEPSSLLLLGAAFSFLYRRRLTSIIHR